MGSSPDLASGYGAFGLPFGKKIEAQKPRSSVTDQLDQLDLLDQPFFWHFDRFMQKKKYGTTARLGWLTRG